MWTARYLLVLDLMHLAAWTSAVVRGHRKNAFCQVRVDCRLVCAILQRKAGYPAAVCAVPREIRLSACLLQYRQALLRLRDIQPQSLKG